MKRSINGVRKLVIVFMSVLPLLVCSQQDKSADAKIGLVLSGGGAKGLAHIGALKVIDEAGIKIDYIGGTSMGAIVGALYASGYSAIELDSIFQETNFAELIQDYVPRGAKSFYEKDDSERYALKLPFDNFKVSIPQAFSSGRNIYNKLVKLLYHVKDIDDFNRLPIPFLCMATNVETGEELLLNKGYLPEAIAASGTFPSLFEPVEIDGQILIDGGVLNNYPIDEIRELGADIIIGIDVQHGLSSRDSLGSATEILLQINNFRTVKDMADKRKKTDIYIKPAIEEFSVIDFDKGAQIIEEGVKATRKEINRLKEISTSKKLPNVGKRIMPIDSLTVNRLVIRGNSGYSRRYIKGKLRFTMGEKITFKDLEKGLTNLAGTGNFKTIRQKLVSNGLGTDLVLKLIEDPTKMFIKMGVHYNGLYKSGALINLTKKSFLTNDDVASFDFVLGDNIRYNLQYYIDKGTYWSFGVNSSFIDFGKEIDFGIVQSNFDVIDDDNVGSINFDISDLTNQVYLQTSFREEFAFTVGAEHKLLRYSSTTFNDIENINQGTGENEPNRTFFEDSNYYSLYGKLTLDSYDDKYFPSKGVYFDSDFHLYLFSSDFNDNFSEFSIAKGRAGIALSPLDKLSLNLEAEVGFKLGRSDITSFDFILGGFGFRRLNNFTPFFGYDLLSLPGNSFVKAYSRLDYEIAPNSHLLLTINVANVQDDIFRTGEWFSAPDYSGFGLGYAIETFVGPVQVYYSWSPERRNGDLLFSVGYWF